MKKFFIIVFFIALSLILVSTRISSMDFFTSVLYEKNKLGFCPTMEEEAFNVSKDRNIEPTMFSSSSEVLKALKDGKISVGIVGRKAKSYEISEESLEKVIRSGWTLVSNKRSFVDYSNLVNLDVYTYMSKEDLEQYFTVFSSITYLPKDDALKKIFEGEIVLISWDDWFDGFELVVVFDSDGKVKDFRGAFLYEI